VESIKTPVNIDLKLQLQPSQPCSCSSKGFDAEFGKVLVLLGYFEGMIVWKDEVDKEC
jgi:hypothetical protein